jgi:hypothetical protein
VVNNEGKEDKARGNTREGGLLLFGGVIFSYGEGEGERGTVFDCICISGFTGRSLLEDFHRGHLLLGILGSGARKP